MPLIRIDDIKAGMVLNKDIEKLDTGAILLSSGTVLNNKNIILMKNLGIRHIDVFERKDEKEKLVLVDDEGFLQKHDALADKTKELLSNIKLGKKIIITEINDVVDDLIDELSKSNNIMGKLRQLKETSDYNFKHSLNVSMLATMLGRWLNYSPVELKQISLAGIFHDIGKLKITDDIINKPGKLTIKEFEIVKKHPIYGYNILRETVGISKNVALGVLQHHEREDGSGYPLGVKGDKIHEFAKVIAVCDVFDAMTSNRVYKEKESPFTVAEHVANNSFGILDGRISTIFLNNIANFYVGNIVKLSNGEIGEIIYINRGTPTRPVIKVAEKYIDLLHVKDISIEDIIS